MDRRNFLKYGSLAAGGFAAISCGKIGETNLRQTRIDRDESADGKAAVKSGAAVTADPVAAGAVYTRANPGPWAGKENSHLPKLEAGDKRLSLKNEHPSDAAHFITRHQLRDKDGVVLYDRVYAAGSPPASTFALAKPVGDVMRALAFCNLHGIWQEEFKVLDLVNGFILAPYYSVDNPGPWTGKEAGHLPSVKTSTPLPNGNVRFEIITAAHEMTPEHYISKHQIRNYQGDILAESYLNPEIDKTSSSILEIAIPSSGIQLLSYCNKHGIWMTPYAFESLFPIYTTEKPGPAGAVAAHVPTITLTDTSTAGVPSQTVTITNTHEMLAATHFIYKHQIRSAKGELLAERTLNPAVNLTPVSIIDSPLFKSGLGNFAIYAYCNLHGIWKKDAKFDEVNITYTDTPGLAGGAAATHKPLITIGADTFTVKAPHVMTAEHYISKHQVRKEDGSLVFEKNFASTTVDPSSIFPKNGLKGNFVAYAYCNLHGIWRAPFTL